MKQIFFFTIVCIIPHLSISQNKTIESQVSRNNKGEIKAVQFFQNTLFPANASVFFGQYLEISDKDKFKVFDQKPNKSIDTKYEHYDQYYDGIKVKGAGYNFHYSNDKMEYAHGHYVRIKDVGTIPTLSKEDAAQKLATYQQIPSDSVKNFIGELIIKEIETIHGLDTLAIPKLVYEVYLYANHDNNREIGFVDGGQTWHVQYQKDQLQLIGKLVFVNDQVGYTAGTNGAILKLTYKP